MTLYYLTSYSWVGKYSSQTIENTATMIRNQGTICGGSSRQFYVNKRDSIHILSSKDMMTRNLQSILLLQTLKERQNIWNDDIHLESTIDKFQQVTNPFKVLFPCPLTAIGDCINCVLNFY